MRLAYNGAPFHGWQTQPNAVSVQETLEKAMSMVMRMPMAITGAGRTDTGVNARTMVAHFDVEEPISDTARLVRQLNSIVGRDIAVYQIVRVATRRMHALMPQAVRINILSDWKNRRSAILSAGLLPISWMWRR